MALHYFLPRVPTSACALIRHSSSAASNSLRKTLGDKLDVIRAAGTWKSEQVITTTQAASIRVQGIDGNILNFCANNYLGLSSHPEVVGAAKAALDKYGNGVSSVRFICGTQDIHKELEAKIAAFHNKEDAILYPNCFDANTGLFEFLMGKEDAIFSDQLNHASIIDGIRLASTRKFRYQHKDMQDLASQLAEARDARIKLIVSDGVFSMDGSVTPLKEMYELAKKENALIFLDDCHATGFLGNSGRGTEDFFGLPGAATIINSTLGKALGGAAGGYTVGPKEVVNLARQKSRPYLFSNSLPPPVVAAASKVFDLLMGESGKGLVAKLQHNTKLFRIKMTEAGFKIKGDSHSIVPVMLGDARLALEFAGAMLKKGILVVGLCFPVVPKGEARIRVQISADHSEDDVERCVVAFIQIAKDKAVIS